MKAKIAEDGMLVLTPESRDEQATLEKWWHDELDILSPSIPRSKFGWKVFNPATDGAVVDVQKRIEELGAQESAHLSALRSHTYATMDARMTAAESEGGMAAALAVLEVQLERWIIRAGRVVADEFFRRHQG